MTAAAAAAAVHPRRRHPARRCADRAACAVAGIALLTVGAAAPASAQEIRVAYLTGDSTLPGLLSAWKSVLAERPDLRDRVSVAFVTESLLDSVDTDAVL